MTATTTPKPKAAKKSDAPYIEAVGRRKTAIARVRATEATKTSVVVNDKDITEYFGTPGLRAIVTSPIDREGAVGKYAITIKVEGSGIHSQAEAVDTDFHVFSSKKMRHKRKN